MPGTRKVLLYVEDEPDNFDVALLRLKKSYDLVWARSDREACQRLIERGPQFHAVLMDIELKGSVLDGRGLMALIRGNTPAGELPEYARGVPRLESTPIIVLTAYGDRFPPEELRSLGASQSLAKPVDFGMLSVALATASIRGFAQQLQRKPVGSR